MTNQFDKNANIDPLSGEPGAHPVGTGVGAASAGLAGAVIGSAAGPIGAGVGAVIGSVVGGLAGKDAAEEINPTIIDTYWSTNYRERDYVTDNASYDDYRPAYRFGYDQRRANRNRKFEEVESIARDQWKKSEGAKKLEWEEARGAIADAYNTDEAVYRNSFGTNAPNKKAS